MSALPVKQELHQLVDRLDEPQAERALQLLKSETVKRPWPESVGAVRTGISDLATNPEKYFGDDFGR